MAAASATWAAAKRALSRAAEVKVVPGVRNTCRIDKIGK